jgi:putative ABC transport system permease protein
MSFKLAFKNIKKSIKDYSIYFFTLVVAVAIFYIFNSIEAQTSMMQMAQDKARIIETLVDIISYISIFISVILGFLIVYSNNFLVKRRKKEFGLYLTLGMSKRKVSMILVIETLLVGLISLGIGLILGIFLSQFLSILTAKLFEVNMSKFSFVFSSKALLKTILYFGIIFILVMIFNVISISKYKLINLLNANKKNEKIKLRNKYLVIITFILSIALLSYAYYLLFNDAIINFTNKKFLYMIISGAIGTFLLFFSAAGFFLRISQLNKKFYYKNLNMFVLKQVNNKVNTTVISTTIICLMLLLTIGILSSSISLVNVFNTAINSNNETDFTISESKNICENRDGITYCHRSFSNEKLLSITNKSYFNEYVKNYVYYQNYNHEDLIIKSILSESNRKKIEAEYDGYGDLLNERLDIISESDYNKILELYGKSKEKVNLNANEYILTSNLDAVSKYYKSFYENDGIITLNNQKLNPKTNKIINIAFINSSGGSNVGTIILDDSLITNLDLDYGIIIGNYEKSSNIEEIENLFINELNKENNTDDNSFTIEVITKARMENASISIKAITTFIGLYLGIIFAISSATVLAIGQLSEASDNKERYKVLRELGATNKMIKKALISQIAIAFGFPLIIAIIHSIFGLKEINNVIKILGNINLTSNIILTSLFIILLFGGYFFATYIFSKNIIKE